MGEKPALRALAWSSAGTGVAFASNILATIWLSRILGPTIVGTSAAVLAICTIFRAGLLLPIVQATVTDPAQAPAFRRSAGALSLWIGSLGCLALGVGGYAMSWHLSAPFLAQICALAGASLAMASFGTGRVALLQRRLKFRVLSTYQACGAVVGSLVVAPMLAYSYLGPISLAAAALAAASIESAGALWATRGLRAADRRTSAPRVPKVEVARATAGFASVGIASSLALQGDTLVVAVALGSGPAGLYSRAYRLMALPANVLGDVADAVLLSAGTQASLQRLRRAFSSGSLLALLVTWPIGLVGIVIADDLVDVLLGPEWSGSVPVLQALCVALPFRVAYKGPALILKSRRRTWLLTLQLAAYAAMVIGLASVGAQIGLVWVGVGVSASLTAFYYLVSSAVARELSSPNRLVSDNALALGLALPAFLAALTATEVAGGLPALARLTLTCGAAAVGLAAAWVPTWSWSPGRIAEVKELWIGRRTGSIARPSPLLHSDSWGVEGTVSE